MTNEITAGEAASSRPLQPSLQALTCEALGQILYELRDIGIPKMEGQYRFSDFRPLTLSGTVLPQTINEIGGWEAPKLMALAMKQAWNEGWRFAFLPDDFPPREAERWLLSSTAAHSQTFRDCATGLAIGIQIHYSIVSDEWFWKLTALVYVYPGQSQDPPQISSSTKYLQEVQ